MFPRAGVRYHFITWINGKKEKEEFAATSHEKDEPGTTASSGRSLVGRIRGGTCRRSYRKMDGVDWLCAINELQLLGMEIDPEYVSQLRRAVQEQAKKNHENRLERKKNAAAKEWSELYPFSEGDYYFR